MTTIGNQNVDKMLEQVNNLNLTGASSSTAASVKNSLETLFTETATMNEGEEGAKKIEKQIAALQEKIGKLENEAEEILKKIQDKNEEINKNGDQLSKIASDLTGATGDLQTKTKEAARQATKEAILSYKRKGNSTQFEECFNQAFQKNLGGLKGCQAEIQALYDLYEINKNGITSIAGEIENALNQVNGLESQLENINGTISLLTRTKNVMEQSKIEDAYKNTDTDANVPVFSGAKAEFANELLSKYSSRNEEAKAPQESTVKEAQEKWSAKNTEKTNLKSSDYLLKSTNNKELVNLNKCIEAGMLEDLQANGMDNQSIMEFIQKNWNIGLKYDKKENTWTIPKGHESAKKGAKKGACEIYDKLRTFANSKSTVTGAGSVNQTQMSELKKAVNEDGILTKMYEKGFTFKEAMYTLTKLFPDAGISYDLNSQSKERNYGLVKDNKQSGSLYETIDKQVLKYWNVGSTTAKANDSSITGSTKYDPITFQNGDTTYTFITDRNNDGKFDYTNGSDNELLGSKNGIDELKAYDLDGDGKISGDELKNVLIMANKQKESVSNGKDVDNYKTGAGGYTNSVDFNVSYSTAADLGITEIDLNSLAQGNNTEDINGSVGVNTFNLTMNGQNFTANETLNTEGNLETFYGQIAKNSNAGTISKVFSKEEFNSAFGEGAQKKSETIEHVKEELEKLKGESGPTPVVPEFDSDYIHNITGTAYLNGARDSARSAAKDYINNPTEASDAAEKAVEDYFKKIIPETELPFREENKEDN